MSIKIKSPQTYGNLRALKSSPQAVRELRETRLQLENK
jgi:hypothetical protein|tara:strand:- start:4160 stop:4273 length:114 start_codon:yes stop_codon:yes gene_type:complete